MTEASQQLLAKPRFVVGTMTGTSIDGDLDAALVEIHGYGVEMRGKIVATRSWPLGDLAADLRRVAAQEPMAAAAFARIARTFGEAHAEALAAVCADAGIQPDLAVLHGQTVFHAPPLTWQLIDPWPVAIQLRCRVRYDLRSANVASGGQGAPITPLADFVLFAHEEDTRTVVNLGGFVNATVLPARPRGVDLIRGFDVCACNHLLDRVARDRLGVAFDADGEAASRGRIHHEIAASIARGIIGGSDGSTNPRSLGTGDEAAKFVDQTAHLSPEDACRTVVEAIGASIVDSLKRVGKSGHSDANRDIKAEAGPLLIAGGSARNRALRRSIADRWSHPVWTTEESNGIPVGMREAAEMAILGALADDWVRYSLPAVTGAPSLVPESAIVGGFA